MKQEELQAKVLSWANDKGLLKKENCFKQLAKVMSELGELGDAMLEDNEFEIEDALGDVQVTIIILACQLGIDYDKSLETAYNVIKNRTGKNLDGIFIKD